MGIIMKRALLVMQIINVISILIFFNTIIHDYLFSYTLTRTIIVLQFIWIMFGFSLFCKRKIAELDFVLLFLLPLLLLQYVVKGYSSGFALLSSDIKVLPRMRASTAYEMLHNLGHLDPQLDPHLAYPQEFIVLHILSLITSRPVIELYEGVMKIVSLTFWSVFAVLLYKFLYKSVFEDTGCSLPGLFLVGLVTVLLLTFPPGYSGEVSYAYPLLVTIFYLLLSKEDYSKNFLLLLVILSLGVIMGSQREAFTLLAFVITTIMFLMLHRSHNSIKISLVYVTVSILALLQLLYNAQLYVAGYGNYLRALLNALNEIINEIIRGEVQIRRPPLHTVLPLSPPIDRWLNTIGSVAFLTTLILSGGIGLITFLSYVHGLVKKEMKINSYGTGAKSIVELGITVTFLIFSFIVAVQYIANIFGLWTIDFESAVPLIKSTVVFIPLIGMRTLKHRLKKPSKHSYGQSLFSLLVLIIVFFTLFSPLGLNLRTVIRSYADTINVRGDPIELTILANNVYNFLLHHGPSLQAIILDSRFSGHYLYLPLKYIGFNVAMYDYHQQVIIRDADALWASAIVLNNGDYILYLRSINIVCIYDGEHVIMPH